MTREQMRRMLRKFETVQLRRFVGSSSSRTFVQADAAARVEDYVPAQMEGNLQQGDRWIMVLAEDLEREGFPLPITTRDFVLVRGSQMRIGDVDDSTYRLKGQLLAVVLTARGEGEQAG